MTRIGRPCNSGQLVDDRPDPREVGVTGVGRRRVDADEQELAVGDIVDVERVRQALGVLREQLGHTVLVERHGADAQRPHLLRDDVRITTSWPSSARHAPVTRPTQPAPKTPTLAHRRRTNLPGCIRGFRPLAIASIVSFESESSSVFTTQ